MDPRVRKQKSGDQLAVGDWLAPGALTDSAAEVLFAYSYPASGDGSRDDDGKHVQLVVLELGQVSTYALVVGGNNLFDLARDEDLAKYRETAKRAQKVADLRALANFFESNSWAPMPYVVEASVHLDSEQFDGPTDEQAYAEIRQLAARLGVIPSERLDDRTRLTFTVGEAARYEVVAWHKDGRPAEPDPEPAAEDLGDDFDRSQTADADTTPVPTVGKRHEPHTGAVTDGGLIDLPECSVACADHDGPHLDDCPRRIALEQMRDAGALG